jgi:polysaccharide export outer membrane protein
MPVIFALVLLPTFLEGQPAGPPQGGSRPPVAMEAPYRLEPGDEIEIRFVTHADYNERGHIRPDGRFSLPGVGEITAAGLTVEELRTQLLGYYKFLRNPDPTVQVRAYGNRKVFVGGDVARPGPVLMYGPKTVAEAVVECGGMRETAHRGSVILIRRGADGKPVTYRVGMYTQGKGQDATTTVLQPYDVVVITESSIAKLDRAVDQYIRRMIPGLLTAGFTYLSGRGTFVPR